MKFHQLQFDFQSKSRFCELISNVIEKMFNPEMKYSGYWIISTIKIVIMSMSDFFKLYLCTVFQL